MAEKWIVPKDALEATIKLIDNVPTRNGIHSSEFIKISKVGNDGAHFSLTSDVAAEALLRTGEKYPFGSDLYIDRRLFFPFVAAGKESKTTDYIFLLKEDSLIIKHGNRRGVYSIHKPIGGYEELGKLEGFNTATISKKWTTLVDAAENCATPDPVTPSLNCVYICPNGSNLDIVSSNDRLVFYGKAQLEKKNIKGPIAFPLLLVKTLLSEGVSKISWTNKLAVVEFPKGKVWQSVKTKARKNFPYKDIVKMVDKITKEQLVLSVASHAFAKVADRIATCVAPLSADDLALELHIEKGSKKIQIVAGSAESKFNETLFALSEAKISTVIEWPLAQIMPIILYCKDEGNARVYQSKTGETCFSTKNINLVIAARSK